MQGHEVHALLGLLFHFREQAFRVHVGRVIAAINIVLRHAVQGHGSQRGGTILQHAAPDGVKIARNGQVHHGIGSGRESDPELGAFTFGVILERGGADIGVYLDAGRLAHDNGSDVFVGGVAEQNHGTFVQGMFNRRGRQLLFLRNALDMGVKQRFQGGIQGNKAHGCSLKD